jgi:hypothetical protein
MGKLRNPGKNISIKLRKLRRQEIKVNLRKVTLEFDDIFFLYCLPVS